MELCCHICSSVHFLSYPGQRLLHHWEVRGLRSPPPSPTAAPTSLKFENVNLSLSVTVVCVPLRGEMFSIISVKNGHDREEDTVQFVMQWKVYSKYFSVCILFIQTLPQQITANIQAMSSRTRGGFPVKPKLRCSFLQVAAHCVRLCQLQWQENVELPVFLH